MSLRCAAALFCASLLVACGARSSLRVGAEQRTQPPAGGSGGGGAGGLSPAGGGPSTGGGVSCATFEIRQPRSFDTLTDHVTRAPQLVPTSADDSVASLVVRADMDPPLIDGNSTSTQVTFEPWGAWPDVPLGTERVLFPGTVSAVAPRTREDGISLLTSFATFATGSGVAAIMDASTDDDSPPAQTFAGLFGEPMFMTGRGATTWGFGLVNQDATPARGTLGTVKEAAYVLHTDEGCGSNLRMDGVRSGDLFIAATWDACSGSGADLRVVVFDDDGVLLRYTPYTSSPIQQLYMLPRRDGHIWMLYQPLDEPLYAEHLDEDGVSTNQRFEVIGNPELAHRVRLHLGATAVGNGVAVVYPQTGADLPPFALRMFDEDGESVLDEGFSLPTLGLPPNVTERLALLASRDGDRMLLAWSQPMYLDEVAGDARTYVTRIDCAPSP